MVESEIIKFTAKKEQKDVIKRYGESAPEGLKNLIIEMRTINASIIEEFPEYVEEDKRFLDAECKKMLLLFGKIHNLERLEALVELFPEVEIKIKEKYHESEIRELIEKLVNKYYLDSYKYAPLFVKTIEEYILNNLKCDGDGLYSIKEKDEYAYDKATSIHVKMTRHSVDEIIAYDNFNNVVEYENYLSFGQLSYYKAKKRIKMLSGSDWKEEKKEGDTDRMFYKIQ